MLGMDKCENVVIIYILMFCFLICSSQVLLKTSAGDIDIELWSKEAPKACRNFVQLCMEGKDLMNTNLSCQLLYQSCNKIHQLSAVFDNRYISFDEFLRKAVKIILFQLVNCEYFLVSFSSIHIFHHILTCYWPNN